MSLADAKRALTTAGLELGTVIQRNDNGLQADTVISASEEADAEVAPKTVVNLVVASGKVTLTDVVGWTVEAATANPQELGLTAVPIEQPDCAATTPPTVVSMSAAPGDVPVASPVELRYCTGS
jgi:serine/threonine-protein kinase